MRKIAQELEKVRDLEFTRRSLLESGAVRVVSEESNISEKEKRALKNLVQQSGQASEINRAF